MLSMEKMIESLEWLINCFEEDDYEAYDEEECGVNSIYLPDVVTALRDKAQTVFDYSVECDFEMGFRYRGKDIFRGDYAIPVYKEIKSQTCDNHTTITYYDELWLMQSGEFAVIRCVNMTHNDGVKYETEYRNLLGIVEGREDLFFTPEDLLDDLEEECYPVWEGEAIIYEGLPRR